MTSAPPSAAKAAVAITRRRAVAVAAASSGNSVIVPRQSTRVETGHAKLPSAMYRNRSSGNTTAKITSAGRTAAKPAPQGERAPAKLAVIGNPPRPAAMAVSRKTKLAPGAATAVTTASTAPSRDAAIQNPQKPARRASQATVPPALLVRANEITDTNAALFDPVHAFAGSIARSRSCPSRTHRPRRAPDTPSSCSRRTAHRRRLRPAFPRHARTARRPKSRAGGSALRPVRARKSAPSGRSWTAPSNAPGS